MFLKLELFVLLISISAISCRPQQQDVPVPAPGPATTPIPIISQNEVIGENGSFNYTFETGNGIKAQQAGYTKPPIADRSAGGPNDEGPQSIQVISGSYSYQAPDGTQISLTYIADENGFQPEGVHLPTVPPVPQRIQELLNSIQQMGTVGAAAVPGQNTAPPAPGAVRDSAAAASNIPNIEILRP